MKSDKIVLIGMMGCGKTTVAKLLVKKLSFELCDLDKIFEKENNIKIKDYFKDFGEENFREKETELLKREIKKTNVVISTGGGIVLREENRDILFDDKIKTIYLKASSEIIFNRIKYDKSRPLLLVDDPKSEIEKILNNREKYYELSKLKIDTDNKTPEEICENILKEL